MAPKIIAIAAMDKDRVIGKDNRLPWHIPEDMRRVSELTTGHTVLMGRKTFESLPPRFRPLPNRVNVIVSRNPQGLDAYKGIRAVSDPLCYINAVRQGEIELVSDILWIFGGAEIYRLTQPYWDELYLTLVRSKHDGDAFFPAFEDQFDCIEREDYDGFSFLRYVRIEQPAAS